MVLLKILEQFNIGTRIHLNDYYGELKDNPDEDIVDDEELDIEPTVPQGGLAPAIAKAKTVQQEKITPPKQAAKSAPGVRKL